MSDSLNFLAANLNENQLQKVKMLEQELSKETNENIVVIAYDKKD